MTQENKLGIPATQMLEDIIVPRGTSSEQEAERGGPLSEMLARVVSELNSLPTVREDDDYPEDVAYIRSLDADFL